MHVCMNCYEVAMSFNLLFHFIDYTLRGKIKHYIYYYEHFSKCCT